MSTALRDMPIVATVLAGGQFDAAAVDEEFDGYTADERAGMARALEEIGGRLISLGDQLRRATR